MLTEERFKELLVQHGENMAGVNSKIWNSMNNRLDAFDKKFKKFEDNFEKIIIQTTKTNGSVCTLKEEMKDIKEWRENHALESAEIKGKAWGMWKMITVIGGVAFFVISFASGIVQNVLGTYLTKK